MLPASRVAPTLPVLVPLATPLPPAPADPGALEPLEPPKPPPRLPLPLKPLLLPLPLLPNPHALKQVWERQVANVEVLTPLAQDAMQETSLQLSPQLVIVLHSEQALASIQQDPRHELQAAEAPLRETRQVPSPPPPTPLPVAAPLDGPAIDQRPPDAFDGPELDELHEAAATATAAPRDATRGQAAQWST